jgi:hypothetical protein
MNLTQGSVDVLEVNQSFRVSNEGIIGQVHDLAAEERRERVVVD